MGDLSGPQRPSIADPEAGRPPEASGGGSEARGSSTKKEREKQKRVKTILEKWPPGPKEGTRVLEGRAGAPKKAKGHRKQQGIQDIRQWFEKGGRPSQVAPETREGCGSMEPHNEVKP